MPDFKPIELSDKAWIDPLVLQENSPSADFNFGNMYMWDDLYRQQVAVWGERLVVRPGYSAQPFYAWPVGGGELKPVLDMIMSLCRAEGHAFTLRGVTAENLPRLEMLYPGRVQAEADRDFWDYLYSAEKLATLSGKKMHGQRNHCNRFEKENNWSFRAMIKEDVPACRELLERWMLSCGEDETDGIDDEYRAILRGFDAFEELGLEGGLLFSGEKLIAFTMGEVISSDTFNVHFEKADRGLSGAYAMVNREFARLIRQKHPEILWINREDDTGRPGLRQAKLSYHPERMVEKYTVVISYD